MEVQALAVIDVNYPRKPASRAQLLIVPQELLKAVHCGSKLRSGGVLPHCWVKRQGNEDLRFVRDGREELGSSSKNGSGRVRPLIWEMSACALLEGQNAFGCFYQTARYAQYNQDGGVGGIASAVL